MTLMLRTFPDAAGQGKGAPRHPQVSLVWEEAGIDQVLRGRRPLDVAPFLQRLDEVLKRLRVRLAGPAADHVAPRLRNHLAIESPMLGRDGDRLVGMVHDVLQ